MTLADSDSGARPPASPCEGSLRAVHPVILAETLQETPADELQGDEKGSFTGPSWPVTAGREVVRADRLYVLSNPQALGNPPSCGPVKVPVVGAVPLATQSLAGADRPSRTS
jgi:hypothetical protein